VPSPIVDAHKRGIDFILIRESTEGLFASMGKGIVTQDEARETLVITRKTSQRLFDFSLRLAERRKKARKIGSSDLRRQGQCLQGVCVFSFDFRRASKSFSEREDQSRLCRRLRGVDGAKAVGL
jgi:3-isopropylmalate dehydrogenase